MTHWLARHERYIPKLYNLDAGAQDGGGSAIDRGRYNPGNISRRPINKSWLVPRTSDDLVARRRAIKCWADASYGFLGRSPDHVASFFAGFAGSPAFYARGGQQFADNLLRFAAKAADEDLYISYVIVHPTVDRVPKPRRSPTNLA